MFLIEILYPAVGCPPTDSCDPLLNTICLGIQQVILEHFTTDG